ncbi:hypothetical protein ACFL49_03175, partial [Candidatus Omnitrophota bacterium]
MLHAISQKFINGIKKNKETTFCLLVICFYILLQIPPYFVKSFAPDENWFHVLVKNKAAALQLNNFFSFILTQPNELGYGSFYWTFYTAIVKVLLP